MSEPGPFFSIVIPTYNRGELLTQTLHSILVQGDVPIEIIVVDDGSTDNTEALVNQINDHRIKYLKTKNIERGAARNLGRQHSNGLFVNYFDSDDVFYPCLSAIKDFITSNNYPSVVYGSIHEIAPNGTVIENSSLPFSTFKENILFNNFLACGSVFVKREVADAFPFSGDRNLSGSEDWELWLRIYTNHEFVRAPIAIFKQRQHPTRSLFTTDTKRVTIRENLFASKINDNRQILRKRFANSEINLLMADRMTLIALVQLMNGRRFLSFQYWLRSFILSPRVLIRRRFLAVAKKLMFQWR